MGLIYSLAGIVRSLGSPSFHTVLSNAASSSVTRLYRCTDLT